MTRVCNLLSGIKQTNSKYFISATHNDHVSEDDEDMNNEDVAEEEEEPLRKKMKLWMMEKSPIAADANNLLGKFTERPTKYILLLCIFSSSMLQMTLTCNFNISGRQ